MAGSSRTRTNFVTGVSRSRQCLCQCPMCYVPKCFVPYASILCAMYLCAMSYVLSMHLSAKGYACALCHPSPTLQGARNCEPRKNQVWNCQVVEKCATKTQIHTCMYMHIRQFKHTSALAQTQTYSHRAQFWATEVWRSQVVPTESSLL